MIISFEPIWILTVWLRWIMCFEDIIISILWWSCIFSYQNVPSYPNVPSYRIHPILCFAYPFPYLVSHRTAFLYLVSHRTAFYVTMVQFHGHIDEWGFNSMLKICNAFRASFGWVLVTERNVGEGFRDL